MSEDIHRLGLIFILFFYKVISLYFDKEILEVFDCVLLSSIVDESPSIFELLNKKSVCFNTLSLRICG